MATKDFSVIITSFNTKQILLDCLDTIIKYTKGVSYEIIIVENGSKDGSLEAISKYAKTNNQVTLIDAKENTGFGKGANIGVKNATGKYLLFLNSDTLFFENSLKKTLDFIRKKPKLGVYSCQLLNKDQTFQPSGGHFPTLLNVLAWQFFIDDLPAINSLIPSFHPSESAFDKNKKTDWVTGAYMVVPKDIFNKVNGFDENIFMYTEEMEITYRIKQLGLRTYLDKSHSIIHLGGASSGSYLALTSEIKNMIYFWKKHKPNWQLPIIKLSFIAGSLLRWLIFGIIKKDETRRRAYATSIRDLI